MIHKLLSPLLLFIFSMQRLPEEIKVKHEKMKEEMIGLSDNKNIDLVVNLQYFPIISSWYMYISISAILIFFFLKKECSYKICIAKFLCYFRGIREMIGLYFL